LRFFDFLPLYKILFAAAGGDLTYETASVEEIRKLFLRKPHVEKNKTKHEISAYTFLCPSTRQI
jgi:hypothetical protein